jgi:chemotaxis protein methyltransferase CheR
MKPADFELLSGMLRSRSGLVLSKDKVYLLETRLMPVARKRGLENVEALVEEVRTKKEEPLFRDITEAMTTNETFFYRDNKPFDTFRDDILPHLIQAREQRKTIRIWCAAASTGQEPYSLCMILKEAAAKLNGWRIEIIATDLSSEVLEKAKVGLYSQFEVQRGLPITHLVKYFKQVGELWQIDESIRSMVSFRELNLMDDFSRLGMFDLIMCRNVLIYFDQETKNSVLERVAQVMPSDGRLILGAAETVIGVSDKFKPVPNQRGVYALAQPTKH